MGCLVRSIVKASVFRLRGWDATGREGGESIFNGLSECTFFCTFPTRANWFGCCAAAAVALPGTTTKEGAAGMSCQAGGGRRLRLLAALLFKWSRPNTPISASLAFRAPDTAKTPPTPERAGARGTPRQDTAGSCYRASYLFKWLRLSPLLITIDALRHCLSSVLPESRLHSPDGSARAGECILYLGASKKK